MGGGSVPANAAAATRAAVTGYPAPVTSHTWVPTYGPPERRPSAVERYGTPALVFVVALVLYLRTLLPGQAFDDWGEMQVVPHVLGIPHPTGYPTYVLLAWLFELLPLGSIAFRANLFAAVCVAVALAAATSIQQRLGVRPLVAAGAAIATGAIGTVWASAVVAEVNALHIAFIALILERALAWADRPRLRTLAVGSLLIGLSMGNHLLTAFVVPFLVLHVLWSGRDALSRQPRWLVIAAAMVLAGASVYAYLPIAAALRPPLPYNSPDTPGAFLFLVTGQQFRGQYGGLFTLQAPGTWLHALPDLWALAVSRATPVVPALAAVGLVALLKRHTAIALALLGIILTGTYIWANYLRLEHYLLVAWLAVGILAGVGIDGLVRVVRWAGTGRLTPARVAAGPLGAVAAVAMAAVVVTGNLAGADLSTNRSAEVYVDQVFTELPKDAVIFSFWGASPPLWYAQLVDGRRPDVLVVDDTNIVYEGWVTREARAADIGCTRPMYAILALEQDVAALRVANTLSIADEVMVGGLGPTAKYRVALWKVVPRSCA